MNKYTLKKIKNQEVISYIVKHVTDSGYLRINLCGGTLAFMANNDFTKKRLHSGNFCENRFCPMCSWRQAKKDALKISVCMKHIEAEHDKTFIFLTLTAPNVKAKNLVDEINRYNYAFKKLMLKKEITPVNKGYIRKLEITYDNDELITYGMWHGDGQKGTKPRAEYYGNLGLKIGDANPNYDTYHPHFHVVIAVSKSYFKTKYYVKQEKWLDMWREVMNDQSITQVDVRKVKKNEESKEISEIAKYAAKDAEMMTSREVFDAFYNALKGRQVLTYNGLFKDANKLFKQGKLDRYKKIDETEYVNYLLYCWGMGAYVETEKRELTESERKEVNKRLIDESEVD